MSITNDRSVSFVQQLKNVIKIYLLNTRYSNWVGHHLSGCLKLKILKQYYKNAVENEK